MQTGENLSGRLSLHLLDAASGRIIQTWKFEDEVRITVGRSEENRIQLSDQQVSRQHLELTFENEHWRLISHGRNGTRIEGKDVSQVRLKNQTVFQLGPDGPSFRFDTHDSSAMFMATVDSFLDEGVDHLFIDEERKSEEVNEIVEGDAFRALQEQARKLREQGRD